MLVLSAGPVLLCVQELRQRYNETTNYKQHSKISEHMDPI